VVRPAAHSWSGSLLGRRGRRAELRRCPAALFVEARLLGWQLVAARRRHLPVRDPKGRIQPGAVRSRYHHALAPRSAITGTGNGRHSGVAHHRI